MTAHRMHRNMYDEQNTTQSNEQKALSKLFHSYYIVIIFFHPLVSTIVLGRLYIIPPSSGPSKLGLSNKKLAANSSFLSHNM